MRNFRLLIPFYFLSCHAVIWVNLVKDEHEKLSRFNKVRANSLYTMILVVLGILYLLYYYLC